MPNFSQLFGGGSVVKGVQRGVTESQSGAYANYTIKVPISAVNPAKTLVNILTQYSSGAEGWETTISARLLNATTLEIYAIRSSPGGMFGPAISWEVIEFG